MRLLESEIYRGKQIRIYVVYPGDGCKAPAPALGVRIDGQVVEGEAFLQGIYQLGDALAWAHGAVDRLMGMRGTKEPVLTPAPV